MDPHGDENGDHIQNTRKSAYGLRNVKRINWAEVLNGNGRVKECRDTRVKNDKISTNSIHKINDANECSDESDHTTNDLHSNGFAESFDSETVDDDEDEDDDNEDEDDDERYFQYQKFISSLEAPKVITLLPSNFNKVMGSVKKRNRKKMVEKIPHKRRILYKCGSERCESKICSSGYGTDLNVSN